MRRDRGQSMAEFAAGVAALGMLALGTISVSGLQEIQRRGITAAREAAFQGEWLRGRVSTPALGAQLGREHFNDAGLGNATGSGRMVLPGDANLTSEVAAPPGSGLAANRLLLRPLRAVGGLAGEGFDLDEGGYRTGILTTRISGTRLMPEPFTALQLQFDQHFALLGDDWSSAGPGHVARRAGGLVPTQLLSPLSNVWRPLAAPLSLFEPALGQLCFGLIEPDRVPDDRLEPGAPQGAPSCR